MPIGGAEHPEEQLRLEEVAPVLLARHRAIEHTEDAIHARSAVGFVLGFGRYAGGLAHVFLRQPDEAAVSRWMRPPGTIEAQDHQRLDVLELHRPAVRHGQPELPQDQ